MLFYSFFKTLVGKTVSIELKNDMVINGTLQSVDQFLNMKLIDITVEDVERYPHMVPGYVQVPGEAVDTDLLQDAARREAQHVAAQQRAAAAKVAEASK